MAAQSIIIFAFLFALSLGNILPGEIWETGYIDLGNNGDSTFYWIVKARNQNKTAPLILDFAGGPGLADEDVMLMMDGPYIVNEKAEWRYSNYSWNTYCDILYLDNPVAVGFSTVKDDNHLCRNKTCIGHNLYVFLIKFFDQYPEYLQRPFYISGVSYAGHYIPQLMEYLIKAKNSKIKVDGIIMISPYINMIQDKYIPQYALEQQFPNYTQTKYFRSLYDLFMGRVSYSINPVTFFWYLFRSDQELFKATGVQNVFNIKLNHSIEVEEKWIGDFFNNKTIQQIIGVNKEFIGVNRTVFQYMIPQDYFKDMDSEYYATFNSGIKIAIWSGKFDMSCVWYGTEEYLNLYNNDFKTTPWSKITGGQRKTVKNIEYDVIEEAGHMVPIDQKKIALDMLTEFIKK